MKKTLATGYRHPKDKTLTWSGRGRRAKWFNDLLEVGYDKEDLRR